MEDFLREYYSILTKAVEIIAVITAIVVYNKYKNTNVKFFLWFLIYVGFVELIVGYPTYVMKYEILSPLKEFLLGTNFEKNYWWYNIFWVVGSALFYSFYFSKMLKTGIYKVIIKACAILFLISVVLGIVFNFNSLFDGSIVLNAVFGANVILLCTILYFMEVLRSENILSFYKSMNFFIASVLFIWFIAVTPLVFYNIYFSTADWDFIIMKAAIVLSMNVFMYLTFTFALLWCKPQNV